MNECHHEISGVLMIVGHQVLQDFRKSDWWKGNFSFSTTFVKFFVDWFFVLERFCATVLATSTVALVALRDATQLRKGMTIEWAACVLVYCGFIQIVYDMI